MTEQGSAITAEGEQHALNEQESTLGVQSHRGSAERDVPPTDRIGEAVHSILHPLRARLIHNIA